MARRKDDGLVNVFYGLFMAIPPWTCIPIALIAYHLVSTIIIAFMAGKPILKGLAGVAPMAGGAVAFLILLAGFKAKVERSARRKLLARQTGIESIRELSWSSFELLVGQAFRRLGYEVIETGRGGADGGIDLKLKKDSTTTLVQCKQWKTWKVGVKPVRELYGVLMAEGADRAMFVTSGDFTKEARAFAAGKPLELIDGGGLVRLIAPAQAASSAPTQPVTTPPPLPISAVILNAKADPAPPCPRCSNAMVLRTAKRGANVGSQFWGCSTYPKCNGTRQADLVGEAER
jgi:restriction system protein